MNIFKKNNQDPEILLYIKQEPIDEVIKRRVKASSDGLKSWVIVEPESEGRAGWRVDVTGCIRPSKNGLYAEAFRGSPKAIKIDVENSQYTLSKLTNDQQQEIINLKIFKAHYGNILKDLLSALKPYLLILAGVTIAAVVIGAYNAYELSKIPAIYVQVPVPGP